MLARSVLALFCLTWLQLAALPCVMASSAAEASSAATAALAEAAAESQSMTAMDPALMHDCIYCPPADAGHCADDSHAACAYPHDPQVDSRASLAFGMALPAVAPMLTLAPAVRSDDVTALVAPPLQVPRAPFAVSYCRFLK
jgi:hypothetical protein